MEKLITYLEAEKIIKQKEIDEAIKIIPKIVSLCLKKGLDFSLCESVKVIDVRNLKTGFCLTGYYSENLVNFESKQTLNFKIKDIYEKLKTYK